MVEEYGCAVQKASTGNMQIPVQQKFMMYDTFILISLQFMKQDLTWLGCLFFWSIRNSEGALKARTRRRGHIEAIAGLVAERSCS